MNGWDSDPTAPRDERREIAWSAWMAAAEYLKPELWKEGPKGPDGNLLNAEQLDEINKISAAFVPWWKTQIDQCLHVIEDKRGGYFSCVLKKGHVEDHHTGDGCTDEAVGSWMSPEQLTWRRKRS